MREVLAAESFFVLEVHKLAHGWAVGQVETLALEPSNQPPADESP